MRKVSEMAGSRPRLLLLHTPSGNTAAAPRLGDSRLLQKFRGSEMETSAPETLPSAGSREEIISFSL